MSNTLRHYIEQLRLRQSAPWPLDLRDHREMILRWRLEQGRRSKDRIKNLELIGGKNGTA